MEAARVRVAAHLEVILRATAIFITDVAFANIACKYDDFLRSMENACLTMTHDTPYRSSRNAASLFPSRGRQMLQLVALRDFSISSVRGDLHCREGGAAIPKPLAPPPSPSSPVTF